MASYIRPETLDDALAALASRPRTLLAGGTDHYPARAIHAPEEDILDLSALPGSRTIQARDDHWWLPALATWSDVIEAPLPAEFDALKSAARQVGGAQVQNAGTVVGNVCNASPAADGVPCLLALDAQVELASARGTRILPLEAFVLGPRRTARAPDELVTGLRIPRDPAPGAAAFAKLGARHYLVISIVMVAVVARLDPAGRIIRARVAVGACAPRAERLPAMEAALEGYVPDPARVLPAHLSPLAPIDDVRATAAYRLRAALALTRRAVAALVPAADARDTRARAA